MEQLKSWLNLHHGVNLACRKTDLALCVGHMDPRSFLKTLNRSAQTRICSKFQSSPKILLTIIPLCAQTNPDTTCKLHVVSKASYFVLTASFYCALFQMRLYAALGTQRMDRTAASTVNNSFKSKHQGVVSAKKYKHVIFNGKHSTTIIILIFLIIIPGQTYWCTRECTNNCRASAGVQKRSALLHLARCLKSSSC